MITNEMKAKIFALYLGCDMVDYSGVPFPVRGTNIESLLHGYSNTYQLILKPLSEITDEDLIEMSRIVGMTDEEISSMDNVNAETKVIWAKQMLEHGEMTMEQADFLRSKGYALPAFGIDLFESSLAIPKQ